MCTWATCLFYVRGSYESHALGTIMLHEYLRVICQLTCWCQKRVLLTCLALPLLCHPAPLSHG